MSDTNKIPISKTWLENSLKHEFAKKRNLNFSWIKSSDFSCSGFGFDTRKGLSNLVFIALKGESFDAHDFLDKAVQNKAGVLILDHFPAGQNSHEFLETLKSKYPTEFSELSVLKVSDSLVALQSIAAHYRDELARLNPKFKVLGVAGSNGKTTTKEFTRQLLSQFLKVHASEGSFNNHWGVPFTILSTPLTADVLVLEMGMNHYDELALLAQIGRVDAACITSIGVEHIEFFGDLDGIAKAESEIFEYTSEKSIKIFNADYSWIQKMAQDPKLSRAQRKIIISQKDPSADIYLQVEGMSRSELKISGKISGVSGQATVPVFGVQNVGNIMAAIAFGLALEIAPEKLWAGISQLKTYWGRNQWVQIPTGGEILFDAYNSNPESMTALIENLKQLHKTEPTSKKWIGVFGQMKELGSLSPDFHRQIGALVGTFSFERIWFCGEDSSFFNEGLESSGFKNYKVISNSYEDSLAIDMASVISTESCIVIKGSRGVKLERFLEHCDSTGGLLHQLGKK